MVFDAHDKEAPENDNFFSLEKLVRLLAPDDPVDLLAAVAGLQLLPENADRGIRLEALAHICAARRRWHRKSLVNRSRLYHICASPALRRLRRFEDPFPNPFTENITFFGGGFIVFPGRFDETTFVLRHLAMALFQTSDPFPDAQFVAEVRGLILAVLAISDAMARRAGLERGVAPRERADRRIVVPSAGRLRQLKRAVRFRRSDLTNFLVANGFSPDTLDDLIIPMGQISISHYRLDHGELFARPIVSVSDYMIVALPGQLLAAVRHAIIRRAHVRGLRDKIAQWYSNAIAFTAHESLALLSHPRIALRPETIPDVPLFRSGFRSVDTDKLMYVALVTDALQAYNEDAVYASWDMSESAPMITEHLRMIVRDVRENIDPTAEILCLLLVQGVGHPPLLSLPEDDLPLTLVMTVADLQTIAWLPNRDQLTLWKFARATERVRQHTFVHTTSLLDEYEWYRRNGSSYALPDPEAEAAIILFPVGAGPLRREVVMTYDPHAVPGYRPDSVIEVMRIYGPESPPIFVPSYLVLNNAAPIAVVVELGDIPIWITGPLDTVIDSMLRPILTEFTDAIAYWLWRCGPQIVPILTCLAVTSDRLHLQVQLADSETWSRPWTSDEIGSTSVVDVQANQADTRVDIALLPAAQSLFVQANNGGEQVLLTDILQGIRALLMDPDILGDHDIAEIVDFAVPSGGGKRIIALDLGTATELDPRGLPPYRPVCEADRTGLLDELAIHLKMSEFPTGTATGAQRAQLLDLVVKFFYGQLEALVATLDPAGLLEDLIAQHEALVYSHASHELQAHNPLGLRHGHHMEWIASRSEWTETAMASRFLLEYVAARPPAGERVFSLSTYDRLLALGSLIVHWGLVSDLIHYEIVDIGVELQVSGRITLDREQYARALASYLVVLGGKSRPSTAEFLERYTPIKTLSEKPAIIEDFDRVGIVEWGLTLSAIIMFMDVAVMIGQEQGVAAVMLPTDMFQVEMAKRLSWPVEQVSQALRLLSLSSRDDFLKPPPGYKQTDIYPWHFNRSLSYARRPFLIRERDGTKEVVWGMRHVEVARQHLLRLCFERRLQATSQEMQQLLGQLNAKVGEPFNNEVAELFRMRDGKVVYTRVENIGKLRVPGDIDVLVIDHQRHYLLLVECKTLAVARTPQEMGTEIRTLFTGRSKKPSVVARHQERVAWLENHLDAVLTELSLDSDAHWVVQGMIVVDTELFTPFLVTAPVRVVSFAELAHAVEQERL